MRGIYLFFIVACITIFVNGCNATNTSSHQSKVNLFVSLPAADMVVKINSTDGSVIKKTVVGKLPHHFVLSKDKKRIYVVLSGSQAVAELDAATGDVLRTMLTEPVPRARKDGSVIQGHVEQNAFTHQSCFDCHHGGQGGVKPAIVGSRPFGIALSEDGSTLYVANSKSGNVALLDVASGKIKKRLNLDPKGEALEPTALALLGNQLFVSILPVLPSYSPAVIRHIDTSDLHVVADTETGSNANTVYADMTRNQIYVSNFETNTISRLDAAGKLLDKLTVGPGPLGVTPWGTDRLLVANYYDNSISWIVLDSGSVHTMATIYNKQRFVNPTHIVLSRDAKIAYVVSSGTKGHLLRLDLQTMKFIGMTPLGGLPFGIVAVDATASGF